MGVNFHAESHDQNIFSKLENFTLSRSNVWNLPLQIGLNSSMLVLNGIEEQNQRIKFCTKNQFCRLDQLPVCVNGWPERLWLYKKIEKDQVHQWYLFFVTLSGSWGVAKGVPPVYFCNQKSYCCSTKSK